MDAKALLCYEDQSFELADVKLAEMGENCVLIKTLYSGVSIGTEFALIANKISWGPYPLCTGYQGVGVVEKVGSAVADFKPGEKVFYRCNKSFTLADGRTVSTVTGTHSSYAVIDVTDNIGLDHLPDGIDLPSASMFVMPAVGLFGVDMSNPRMGQTVVVNGCGLIGLGVVAACSLRGCAVVAQDIDEKRLTLAGDMGADYMINPQDDKSRSALQSIIPDGADVVFESTGVPALIDSSVELCKPFGKFVWQGNYGEAPISMHFLPAHNRRLKMFFPCDDGFAPCRRAVLKNMKRGALPWEKTITDIVDYSDAPEFYERINKREAPDVIGAAIKWSE